MCMSLYVGHFDIYNKGHLFDFASTHAISTPGIQPSHILYLVVKFRNGGTQSLFPNFVKFSNFKKLAQSSC